MTVTRIRLTQKSVVTYVAEYTREEAINLLASAGANPDELDDRSTIRLGQLLEDALSEDSNFELHETVVDDAGEPKYSDPDDWQFDGTFEAVR